MWSDSDLQEHPLQQVSEKTSIAREDDSGSNNGYVLLSMLSSMAIELLYPIPSKSEKFYKLSLPKIWIFCISVWYILLWNKNK